MGGVLAGIAGRLLEDGRVGRLVLSGGETSAAVCRHLALQALEVGLPIEPGVPFCFPLERPGLALVLKSGNFGSPDFYARAAGCGGR